MTEQQLRTIAQQYDLSNVADYVHDLDKDTMVLCVRFELCDDPKVDANIRRMLDENDITVDSSDKSVGFYFN